MKTYEIKITGSGTQNQILCALNELEREIQQATDEEMDGFELEDPTLFTSIKEQ